MNVVNEDKFVATPEDICVSPDGTMYFHFSNALTGCDMSDQDIVHAWSQEASAEDRADEVVLNIVVDLPGVVRNLVSNTYGEEVGEGYLVGEQLRPRLDVVRKQLEDALAILNKVQYATEDGLIVP